MGVIILVFLIYFFIFLRLKAKRTKMNRTGSGMTPVNRPANNYNSASRKQPSEQTGYERKNTGPEACYDDHERCSHISSYGKFKDFEDRNNDWLARQMAEERKALRRLNY